MIHRRENEAFIIKHYFKYLSKGEQFVLITKFKCWKIDLLIIIFRQKNKQHISRHEQISKRKEDLKKKYEKKKNVEEPEKDSKGKFRHKSRQEYYVVNGFRNTVNKERWASVIEENKNGKRK